MENGGALFFSPPLGARVELGRRRVSSETVDTDEEATLHTRKLLRLLCFAYSFILSLCVLPVCGSQRPFAGRPAILNAVRQSQSGLPADSDYFLSGEMTSRCLGMS